MEREELVRALNEYIYEDRVEDKYRLKEMIKQAVGWISKIDAEIGAALRAGAEEGFSFAKLVYLPQNYGGLTDQQKQEVFGTSDLGPLSDLTHEIARNEYEEWKERTDPQVGDQIILIDSEKMGVITLVYYEANLNDENGTSRLFFQVLTEDLKNVSVERDAFKLTGKKIDLENGQFKEIGENGDEWRSEIEEIKAKYTIGVHWWAAATQETTVSVH